MFEQVSADCARITVIDGIGIAHPYLEFKVPVTGQGPGIAVGHPGPHEPALYAVVGEYREVRTEKPDVVLKISEIILASEKMEAEEMPDKLVAQPVASLGLHEPVFPALLARHDPVVVVRRCLQCPFRGQGHFRAEIYCRGSVIEQVSLDSKVLSGGRQWR